MKTLSMILLMMSTVFFGCTGNQTKQDAKEAEKEMDKMNDPVEGGSISDRCKGHLDEFEKLLAEYAAITKKYLETKEVDEAYTKDLETRMQAKLDELSKNSEIFMDADCTTAFQNAQQKFATYVQDMAMAKARQ